MKNIIVTALLLGAFLVGGCAEITLPEVSPIAKSGTIRVGFSSSADVGDVPSLMAHELLRAQGYTVEVTNFAGADLEIAALTQGQLDIGNGSMRTLWLGLDKHTSAHTIMEQVGDVWLLVAKPEIKTCADMHGKRIAFTNRSSLSYALFDAYTQDQCPNLEYELLLISSSGNRTSALLAGELDGAPLQLADWIQLQKEAPNKFHALVNFSQELPELKTTGVHARRAFAEEQPEAVRDYIRALLTVHRSIRANPEALQDAAVKYLKFDPATAETVVKAYTDLELWDVNGGLTPADVQYSIDFFTRTESIPEGLTVDGVSDLSYLQEVLDEIGRK